MGYLICDKCKGYYQLQEGESPEDFSKNCECGGNLIYKENLDFNSPAAEDTKPETEEKIETTVSKKDDSVKYCETCGQPLPSSKKAKTKIDTTKQKKAASKIIGNSKERFMNLSTRNKMFSIGGILVILALIAFFTLPLNLSAAHYDKNNVSFDYPNDWNITSVYENTPMSGDPAINNTQLDIKGPGINVGTIDIYTIQSLDLFKAGLKNPQNLNGYTYYETISDGGKNTRNEGIILDEKNKMGCTILIAGKKEQVNSGFKMIVNSFRFK